MLRAASSNNGGGVGLKSAGVLAHSAVAVNVTGTAVLTTVATISIPAGEIGANGALRITANFSYTNSVNAKTAQVTFGAQTVASYSGALTSDAGPAVIDILLSNRGATNSQAAMSLCTAASHESSQKNVLTVDSTQPQNLLIQAQLATSTETITLESYLIEVVNP